MPDQAIAEVWHYRLLKESELCDVGGDGSDIVEITKSTLRSGKNLMSQSSASRLAAT